MRAIILMCAATVGLSAAESLEQVRARMDASAAAFQSLSAKVRKVTYTAVIKDTQSENGTFLLKRVKAGDLRVRMEISQPDVKSIALSRNRYELYLPKISTVQEFDLGKYRSLVDQFLLLGFGTPSKDLLKSYDMKALGAETLDGKATTKIELVPKSAGVLEHLKRVEMWIPLTDGNPIQQKFYQPSGDYFMSTYTDVKINPVVKDTDLALTLPKGVKREFPQK
jgi:outer membrane lipoprotein-sorting protein